MNTRIFSPFRPLLLALFALFLFFPSPLLAETTAVTAIVAPQRAVVISLEGDVDQGMAIFVERAIRKAIEIQKADLIIFDINTFGGLLESAFTISDTLLSTEGVRTVALVDKKAISAGALIALSTQELFMRPSTTIGDCAPVISGQEGPVMLGEKIQSPLRARFRTLAEKHGYPSLLSQAMVSEELEVIELTREEESRLVLAGEWKEMSPEEQALWSGKKTLVKAGELLTLTDREAERFKFSSGTVDNIPALMEKLGVTSWEKIEISWSEQVARFFGKIAPLLMLVGFGALYMEMQTPGFGIFGIIGISALLLVFGGQSVAGLADHAALAFLILGGALMLLEVFVFPGTWIAGTIGIVLLALAMMLSIGEATPVLPSTPETPAAVPPLFDMARALSNLSTVLFSALAALLFPLVLSKAIARWIPASAGLALAATMDKSKAPMEKHLFEVGAIGVAITLLRPTGKVQIDGLTFEAIAQNSYIESGTEIEVAEFVDGRLFVRPKEQLS